MALYQYLLKNLENGPTRDLNKVLKKHELEVLAKFLQRKFPEDPRTVPQLVQLIEEECVAPYSAAA